MLKLRWALAIVVLAMFGAAGSASAATTIGSDLTATPNLSLGCAPSCTLSSPSLAGSSTASPINGVIVRWRIKAGGGAGPTALRVLRPATGDERVGVGTSQVENPVTGTISTFATQLPIRAGDFIGIDIDNTGPNYFNADDPADSRHAWQPALPNAGPPTSPTTTQTGREVLVNADIEVDADSDGLGDETQDADDDNDNVNDGSDNCQLVANTDQADVDADAQGDACDPDDDNDNVNDGSDNCQFDVNPDQADVDADAQGDACDPDDDNDNVNDGSDNCQFDVNPDQADVDADGVGDACDSTDGRPFPETTIGRAPRNPKSDHTHFRFRSSIPGSSFTCSLDDEKPKPCERHQHYRHLQPGRHVFSVAATSPAGKTDPTPATASFRIKRPR